MLKAKERCRVSGGDGGTDMNERLDAALEQLPFWPNLTEPKRELARRGARLSDALAARIPAELRARISAVVSPAMGGVIAGHEMARALGVEAMLVERPTGTFELRRGFRLAPGQEVLMMEDVVTTGLSSREAIKAIEAAGGKVIAGASLVDRSNGTADLGVPFFPLIKLDVPTYEADALPPELAAIPAIKPGSRAAA